ncbi:Glycosyl transferase, group 1 [Crenothrix polyspora]|uniref:Glycosyl transferase, group 1 n=1 Tax=Crenothrix polyspora TaxID=360316 RepID=A0A1R4H1H1_9GAMM|nr:glycosyltransferase family 4 protein [Crenothrix polyspora]SJM90052.1 Glycosyl transferase, group 1 [Crenothrix polyspora]
MIGTDPLGQGGITSVVSVLVNEGFLQKHNIKYIASHAEGGLVKKLASLGKSIFDVVSMCVFSKPSVVHAHSACDSSFIRKSLLLAIARVFKCKTIFHLHAAGFDQYVTEESGPLMQWWIRRTLEKSTKVIALSDEWADFLGQYAPRADIYVVPNSVRLDLVSDHKKEVEGRILFLGRAEERKGIFELLAAIAQLKSSWPAIKLVIAGDGDLTVVQRKAEALGIVKNIEILGWIKGDQKNEELQCASIFTLPSYTEGLPMSMLEAMSAGKAIVVTPVGGIASVVNDQINGLLIPPGDASALAAALGRLLGDKQLRSQLGANARNTIADRYSSPIVLEKLSHLYDELSGIAQS